MGTRPTLTVAVPGFLVHAMDWMGPPQFLTVIGLAAGQLGILLGEGGVDATVIKMSRSLLLRSGRGGWFNYRLIGGLNEPPRLRRL
jgi:hypothetical protein